MDPHCTVVPAVCRLVLNRVSISAVLSKLGCRNCFLGSKMGSGLDLKAWAVHPHPNNG